VTVYFAQEPSPSKRQPDLSTARRFGEIKFIFDYRFPVSQNPEAAHQKASEILNDFDPEYDFLADCGGDKMALGVLVHVLRDWDCIPFLRWNRHNGGLYEPTYIGVLTAR